MKSLVKSIAAVCMIALLSGLASCQQENVTPNDNDANARTAASDTCTTRR
jgi:hypothetical protein